MRAASPGSFWLIARYQGSRMRVLTAGLAREEALAVFSFPEEARMFLDLEPGTGGWSIRESTAGEITSMLFDPCTGVRRVVLDPLPSAVDSGLNGLLSIGRDRFARFYLYGREPFPAPFERAALVPAGLA